jgi:hypothetical protein
LGFVAGWLARAGTKPFVQLPHISLCPCGRDSLSGNTALNFDSTAYRGLCGDCTAGSAVG